jgi:hypothetical protein
MGNAARQIATVDEERRERLGWHDSDKFADVPCVG